MNVAPSGTWKVHPKMVFTGWQHQWKPVVTAHCSISKLLVLKRLCDWFGRFWFSARSRTKWGRISTCWTSQEIPDFVPSVQRRTDQQWLRGEWWSCLLCILCVETSGLNFCCKLKMLIYLTLKKVLPNYGTNHEYTCRCPTIHPLFKPV